MGHDRVLVENGFGRGQSLFGVLHHKYTWCRERLDEIIDISFSLTNYHIRLRPLRAEDREYYHRVLSTLRAKAEKVKSLNSIQGLWTIQYLNSQSFCMPCNLQAV